MHWHEKCLVWLPLTISLDPYPFVDAKVVPLEQTVEEDED